MNIVNVINSIPAGNFGVGRRSAISQISEHHAVGDASHVLSKARGAGAEFSCTFTIATDGTIYQLVAESNTPYTDNDYRSNGRAITIEHAGGGNYPYTEAMYKASAELHAYLFAKYPGINCVRHRDIPEIKADPSKATACPGGLDVERIIRQAKEGVDMPLPYDERYMIVRSMKQEEPTLAEITDKVWDDTPLAIRNFWSNYGSKTYGKLADERKARVNAEKVAEIRLANEKQIADLFNVTNPDDTAAIVAAAMKSLADDGKPVNKDTVLEYLKANLN